MWLHLHIKKAEEPFVHLHLLSLKNRINGTQRTEQSEVYGTKKEEKRGKRRKSV